MAKQMKGFFGEANSKNSSVLLKNVEPKQKYIVDSKNIDVNKQEIRYLYVSLI